MITAAALLVLVALGLFVGGIAAGSTALYWACVAVSAVAAVLLVAAFLGMRRAVTTVGTAAVPSPRREQAPEPERERAVEREPAAATRALPTHSDPAPDSSGHADDAGATPPRAAGAHALTQEGDAGHAAGYPSDGPGSSVSSTADGSAPGGPTSPPPAAAPVDHTAGAHADVPAHVPPAADGAEDPPVEEVEVTDLLLVVDLHDEVLVVDEHPRYHLADCRWLAGRTTIPLAVDEARTDGFTPCAFCAPDRGLAERERGRRGARGGT